MDKVELSAQDIKDLLKWRDQHQDEVRSHPVPLKAVEIVMPHNGYHIKGVRDGDQLRSTSASPVSSSGTAGSSAGQTECGHPPGTA